MSGCMIEVCNAETMNFDYRRHILPQFTFKLHLAWNVFDFLLRVKGPGVTMVNIGTRIATVNIAFSALTKSASIERKILQYTTLSKKLYRCTLSELETYVFTLSDDLVCLSISCAHLK